MNRRTRALVNRQPTGTLPENSNHRPPGLARGLGNNALIFRASKRTHTYRRSHGKNAPLVFAADDTVVNAHQGVVEQPARLPTRNPEPRGEINIQTHAGLIGRHGFGCHLFGVHRATFFYYICAIRCKDDQNFGTTGDPIRELAILVQLRDEGYSADLPPRSTGPDPLGKLAGHETSIQSPQWFDYEPSAIFADSDHDWEHIGSPSQNRRSLMPVRGGGPIRG